MSLWFAGAATSTVRDEQQHRMRRHQVLDEATGGTRTINAETSTSYKPLGRRKPEHEAPDSVLFYPSIPRKELVLIPTVRRTNAAAAEVFSFTGQPETPLVVRAPVAKAPFASDLNNDTPRFLNHKRIVEVARTPQAYGVDTLIPRRRRTPQAGERSNTEGCEGFCVLYCAEPGPNKRLHMVRQDNSRKSANFEATMLQVRRDRDSRLERQRELKAAAVKDCEQVRREGQNRDNGKAYGKGRASTPPPSSGHSHPFALNLAAPHADKVGKSSSSFKSPARWRK